MRKRILLFLCSFLVIYGVNFFVPRLMPGDPFQYTSSTSGEDIEGYSKEQKEQLRKHYGLDEPLHIQFVRTICRNLQGDLGDSIYYKKPVAEILMQRLPWSFHILLSALLWSMFFGCFLALWCVRSAKADKVFFSFFSVLDEIPSFLIGMLLLFLVAAKVSWIPLSGNLSVFVKHQSLGGWMGDVFLHSLLPVIALTLVSVPQFFFTARASFLTAGAKAYNLYAKAKGLSELRIRVQYILRNSMSPITARFFLSVGTAVGGTILIENVFAYPGLGQVLREAVLYRDYPMIQGVFLLSTVAVMGSLFLADSINASNARVNSISPVSRYGGRK